VHQLPVRQIPIVDVREGGLVRYTIDDTVSVRALRDACIKWLPSIAAGMLPLIDLLTRRWLLRSRSKYTQEIGAIADALGFAGIWFLNGCYQWGCTARAVEQGGAPWLARTLDWPFPGLGRYARVARMRGPAGEFENVTWPGYAGVLTASAPGRFAACANQAPMHRRTTPTWLRSCDTVLNGLRTSTIRFTPPDHLLREVFEGCENYDAAKFRLEETPVARPVIYTLAGCRPGERCVIERTEEDFTTHDIETAAANDWAQSRRGWEARIPPEVFFTRSPAEAAENSRTRREQLLRWPGSFDGTFDWLSEPVLNAQTRLAVEVCPATGVLHVVGYERSGSEALPVQVARTF
jgi:hypothetical protein